MANSRCIEGVRSFAEEVGATPADARGAVEGAEAVILWIPFPAVAKRTHAWMPLADGCLKVATAVEPGHAANGCERALFA